MRILVALDGSSRAPAVLAAAHYLATRLEGTLVPLRAIVVPVDFSPAGVVEVGDPLAERMTAIAHGELASLLRAIPELETDAPVVRVGQPWHVILEVAEELDVDLIVLGSHGYRGWDRVLGTTAGKVVNLAQRNVLVVHERAK